MKLRHLVVAGSTLFAAACSDSDSTDNPNPNPNPQPGEVGTVSGALGADTAAAAGSAVRVSSVDDDGELTLAGEGTLDANGRFSIDDVEAGDGPFVVQVLGSANAEIASVIVLDDIADGDEVTTQDLTLETTAEAGAFIELVGGDEDADDVDFESVKTWVTADLALALQSSSDGDSQLATAITLATQVSAATESQGGTDSDAQAAASFVFAAAFEGSSEAHESAVRIGAELSARATWMAQQSAAAGSSAEATVDAQLEVAYEAFFDALDEADDESDIDQASVALATSLDATLDVLIAAENSGSEDDVHSAINATAGLAIAFQGQLDDATEGSNIDINAVATAYADYRDDVNSSLDASLDVSARLQAFTNETATQSGGHLGGLLDLDGDLIDIIGEIGVELGLSLTGDFASDLDATIAVLLSVSGNGTTEIGRGSAEGGRFTFDSVTEATGTFVVELRDAQGEVEGALRFENITESGSDLGDITAETTVEAQVFLQRVTDQGESNVDVDSIEAWIDARIAAAVDSDDDIEALVDATIAAELVAEGNNDANEARAEAALAFRAVLAAASEGDLEDAGDARSNLEAAFALQAALSSTFQGSSFDEGQAQLDAAVAVLVSSTNSADDGGDIDLAASTFVNSVLAINDGMDGETLVDTAIDASFAAGVTLYSTLNATLAGGFDANTFGSGFDNATGTFQGALGVALQLSTLTSSQDDREVVTTLASYLALGFSGAYSGSN